MLRKRLSLALYNQFEHPDSAWALELLAAIGPSGATCTDEKHHKQRYSGPSVLQPGYLREIHFKCRWCIHFQLLHPGTEVGGPDWEEVKEIYAEARGLDKLVLLASSRFDS